ncbi:scarecrow-like protein 14 [Olea europaea var. sylvestris]|uniref:scarecrow-like protein 14 n=1 Tax=Olea europaea var. sylvestris TaxID=158386 RepID=UPI000C1CE903|nr:scarecrow-like protein 14 [Olea europaea var. sylvestris]XP_022890934.1 scarecrow-like protein 14 [Olea europaea var. sylvestris]XP_022890935.1 scarecrow-like protein 14 [Olea europaea var. sylvestris]
MVMDRNFRCYSTTTSGIKYDNQALSVFPDPNLNNNLRVSNSFSNGNYDDVTPFSSHLNSNILVQSSDTDTHEDYDFSDVVLKYINHILMEEDVEEKACMFRESAALLAAEKSFYEVLGGQYPASTDYLRVPNWDQNVDNSVENFSGDFTNYYATGNADLCPDWNSDPNCSGFDEQLASVGVVSQLTSQSPFSPSSSTSNFTDGPADSPVSTLKIPNIFSDSQSVMQFKKGVEEAAKFLPNGNSFAVDLRYGELLGKEQKEGTTGLVVKVEKKCVNEDRADLTRGKKNPYRETMSMHEERNNKQTAVYTESTASPEMFDMVLLCSGGRNESALRKALQNEATKNALQNSQIKGSTGGKSRGKKLGGRRNVVDLRTLLTLCAQAVAADDRRSANEFLKQIRQHSTPTGDGMQRLAHWFADGLEARMAGSGTQIYKALINLPTSAADILKAYHIYLASCPFRKISNFFANKTIMNAAKSATRLHIIDFGILYGFQWPCFIQRLSSRPGGPPKLRITGIDFPCPGFRPSERVEETGRRLASYAETFNVPFDFNAIAQKWETIKIEDLNVSKDEVVVVNCLYRFRNLLDETVVINSPRNIVLNLIRKISPDIFVQGIVNGAYNAPFFITRFREALFHYSSFFDMLEANIPREIHERMLLEKTIFGQEAMNVIACEAAERIERPETYKQWQVRNIRAGFKQLPLNEEIMSMAKVRVTSSYHKDFVIDEDGLWMLQGWKGRILYALSSWRPAY